MAKAQAGKSGGKSRVRFIMVEAEVDGDLGQITTAIQNALRAPSAATVQRIASPTTTAKAPVNGDAEVDETEEQEIEDELDIEPSAPQRSGPAKPRTFKTPDVVPLEMDADVSLVDFAARRDSDSNHKKYLICAVWLKEHRGISAVDIHHIYTCFRKLGWSVGIPDFGQPLRELKTRKFFTSPERGKYEVNHIGVDYVKKLSGNG